MRYEQGTVSCDFKWLQAWETRFCPCSLQGFCCRPMQAPGSKSSVVALIWDSSWPALGAPRARGPCLSTGPQEKIECRRCATPHPKQYETIAVPESHQAPYSTSFQVVSLEPSQAVLSFPTRKQAGPFDHWGPGGLVGPPNQTELCHI